MFLFSSTAISCNKSFLSIKSTAVIARASAVFIILSLHKGDNVNSLNSE